MLNMKHARRRVFRALGLAVPAVLFSIGGLLLGAGVTHLSAQESDRRVMTRVEPEYPDALKKLYIGGVVRISVEVAPNGSVKNVKLLGGNPILGQSTMKAVRMWKYVPAAADETLTVKLEFDPHK